MKTILEVRRRNLLRRLTRVNHQITRTQKQLAHLEARLARAAEPQGKAA
jgi:hypothetical protein